MSVFARACAIPVSSGDPTTTRWQRPSNRRATTQAPLETSITIRSVGPRLSASASIPSRVIATRPAEWVTPFSQIAISQKSRCRSKPTARPVHLRTGCTFATTHHLPIGNTRWRTRGRTTKTDTCSRHNPGESQGRPERQPRARSASSKTACPTAFATTRSPIPGEPLLRGLARDSCRPGFSCPEDRHSGRTAPRSRSRDCDCRGPPPRAGLAPQPRE